MPVSFLEPGSTVYIAVFQVLESEFLFRHFPGVRIENVEQGGVKTFGVESLYVLPYPFFHHISPIVLHPYDNGVEGAFLFRSIMFDICSGTQRERFNQDSVRLLVDRITPQIEHVGHACCAFRIVETQCATVPSGLDFRIIDQIGEESSVPNCMSIG